MPSDPRLAAFLSTGQPQRFYAGLSLLVSLATDAELCIGLLSFDALELCLAEAGEARLSQDLEGLLSPQGRSTFARSFAALRDTALGLDRLLLYACSASMETMAVDRAEVEDRLDGVMSTPAFLKKAGRAQIIFV